MNRSIYFTIISIGNHIMLNCYLVLYMFFPNYYKDTMVSLKKNSDIYYNKMMLLSFTDDIYNKYQIDLIDIHKNIMTCLNNNNNNNNNDDNNDDNDDNDDNISIMSDLSDLSDISLISEN